MISSSLKLGGAALRWALRFYARHFWLVFGLSLIPTAQRFFVIRFGDVLPAPVSWGSEALTMAARVLLVYLLLRLMVAEFGPLSGKERWRLFTAGIDISLWRFLLQFAWLGVAFVIFDVLPELLMPQWFPKEVFVAVKNPTVIAMTLLWMAGVGRELMRSALAVDDFAGGLTGQRV
ncbi:hypothetical protein [Catelliglobosispora koreensis]|uniref:hypothetical protein n=1 Tax=Catelliglobosispora koreensis TaxID=129052 RepID=UPI00035F4F7A|nr:hypothetical protein [Catelliglobosispora koreensis]